MWSMMYTFSVETVLRGYHEYKDSWPERLNFTSASDRGQRYFKIYIFTPEFAPSFSTHVHANFLSGSWEFYENGDKFGWIKYWWMTIAKVFPARILRYTVY